MTVKRIATMAAGAAALAAWLAAAATSTDRTVQEPTPPSAEPVEARGAALAEEIARLRSRFTPVERPPSPSRNLFQFAIDASPAPPAAVEPLAEVGVPRDPAVAPPTPLRLIGLAEERGAEGTERTAIISGAGQLFLVKVGDPVTSRFRVSRIAGEVVELIDSDGTPLRLALP